MMTIADKPWGTSTRRHLDKVSQLEEIMVWAGGYSSIHLHTKKHNLFVVESGILIVRIFSDKQNNDQTAEFKLTDGEHVTVPPMVRHQFYAPTAVSAQEFYYGIVDPEDIERFSENGRSGQEVTDAGQACRMALCSLCNSSAGESKELVLWQGAMRPMCPRCMERFSVPSQS